MVKQEKSKKKRLGECKLYLLPFAFCLAALPALSAPLQNWRYDPKSNQLEITVKPGVKPRYKFAAYPARIILELPNTEVGQVKRQASYQGAVRQIRVSQAASGMAQVVLILAPNTMLSRDQAQLQQVSERNKYSDRWVLRPLLAGTTNTASVARLSTRKPAASAGLPTPPPQIHPPGTAPNELPPAPSSSSGPRVTVPPINASQPTTSTGLSTPPRTYPPGMAPNELSSPSVSTGPRVMVPSVNTTRLPAAPSAAIPTPPSADQFPPGLSPQDTRVAQPGTTAVTAKPDTPTQPPRSEIVSQAPQKPEIQKPEIISQAPSPNSLRLSAINPSLAIPESLPPVSAPTVPTAPTVSVPPLQRATPTSTRTELPPTLNEASLPSSTSAGLPPTLNEASFPPPASQPTRSQPTIVARSGTIDFGQPLPTREAYTAQNYGQSYGTSPQQVPPSVSLTSSTPGVVLPAGTVLNVRYPGSAVLKLQANKPRQEVLLLQNEIRDRAGNLIIPLGSQVYGRFETNRFVAQSIVIQGRPFPFVAQSDALNGARQVSDRALIRNSGIGAVAGALLGGLSGGTVVGGAAVGAGITYATAPKPATIQPGQIFQVQLTEDLR